MSQLKVNSIVDASGGSNAVLYGPASPAGSMGFRNRIINGDMRIDQRNAGAAVSTDSSYPVDRFFVLNNLTSGTFTAQRSTTAPAGFTNSMVFTTGTAGTASASQRARFTQSIEGNNIADLGWGSANAKTITLSFWVRSSLTGTFAGALRNNDADRSYVFNYTISSANTFEYKTVTIAGDTSGTWDTGVNQGINVQFDLGSGSNFQTTAGSWAAGNYIRSSGAVSVAANAGATWYITGVQLEVGSVATEFERRPYGTELALCQRYYQHLCNGRTGGTQSIANGFTPATTYAILTLPFLSTMRIAPTVTLSGMQITDWTTYTVNADTLVDGYVGFECATLKVSGSGFTSFRPCAYIAASATSYIALSSEL